MSCFTVQVTHVMKTKKMSKREAEQFKVAQSAKMSKPTVQSKIASKLYEHLPDSIKGRVNDVIAQRQKELVSSAEIVSEGRDKYSVIVKNIVHGFEGFSREEAEQVKAELDKSIGKLQGKNSSLEIKVVELEEQEGVENV